MRMWTSLRETYGEMGGSAHPVGRLVSAQPDLRGLLPSELAHRLEVTVAQAQEGLLVLASECFPPGTELREGESFDSLVILAGRPTRPVQLEGPSADGRTSTRETGALFHPVRPFF